MDLVKKLTRVPFDYDRTDELVRFALDNPWLPEWSEDYMVRFIEVLCSFTSLVFDLSLNEKRVAAAVLLDKISNKGNNAALEILGISREADSKEVFDELISLAKEELPIQFGGIEMTFHHALPYIDELATKHRLAPYYETYEMVNMGLARAEPGRSEIKTASSYDDGRVYEVLNESFKDNIDTGIPEYQDWMSGRKHDDKNKTYIAIVDGQMAGFLNLSTVSKSFPEIKTIGVLPQLRGRGIGRDLIAHAMNELIHNGHKNCALTVSVQNRKALELYKKMGFKDVDHFRVYQWPRGH